VLSRMLSCMGAKVTVSARKFSDIAWIQVNGYSSIHTCDLAEVISTQQLIFNTVPATVLDENLLSQVKKDCLLIDLASKPGGIDFDTAKRLGLKTIWALSLPGKVAPISAGKIIFDTIQNIESERRYSLE
ncbi:MAG: dipicolinate synthase subunit DpsA, partial [Oscillospiraceae bacterium]